MAFYMGAHFLLVFFVRYYLTCKIPPYKNYLTFWEWKETIAIKPIRKFLYSGCCRNTLVCFRSAIYVRYSSKPRGFLPRSCRVKTSYRQPFLPCPHPLQLNTRQYHHSQHEHTHFILDDCFTSHSSILGDMK